jgi:hypothetical protein
MAPVEHVLHLGWDLMVAHPPCTHLAVSGSRHFHRKQRQQAEALDFVRLLMAAPIPRWCIENPVSVISSAIRPPDQIIQPWQYGHGEVKATCLWLNNLPKLRPTECVDGREARVHRMPPGPDRWKERSRTFQGVADAMAAQWGNSICLRSWISQACYEWPTLRPPSSSKYASHSAHALICACFVIRWASSQIRAPAGPCSLAWPADPQT